MELFLNISSVNECAYLQEDLKNFVDQSKTLGLKLNIKKCRPKAFNRSYSSTSFFLLYIRLLYAALAFSYFCDFGLTLTLSFCPQAHTDNVTYKVIKVLDFINQKISGEFKPSYSLKYIVCVLVRFVVRHPLTADASNRLKCLQRRFLKVHL